MRQTQKPVSLIMRTRSKRQCYQIWTTTLRPYFASNAYAQSVHGEWKYRKLTKLSCQNCVLGLLYYEKPGFKRVPLYLLRKVQASPLSYPATGYINFTRQLQILVTAWMLHYFSSIMLDSFARILCSNVLKTASISSMYSWIAKPQVLCNWNHGCPLT